MSYDPNDEEQVKKAHKKAEKEKFERDEIIRYVMSKKAGRALINYWLESFEMFGDPHVPNDPCSTAVNIGMANAGKLIWINVEEVAAENCIQMRKEAIAEGKNEK